MKGHYDILESTHDYIQWLFPKFIEGAALAPLLNDSEIDEFMLKKDELQPKLNQAFAMMLDFYGLEIINNNGVKIVKNENFIDRSKQWLTPKNHNYARITRILVALTSLGLIQEAQAFYDFLINLDATHQNKIGQKSFKIWANVMGVKIYMIEKIKPVKHMAQILPEEKLDESITNDEIDDISMYGLEFKKIDDEFTVQKIENNNHLDNIEKDNLLEVFEDLIQMVEVLNNNNLKHKSCALFEYLEKSEYFKDDIFYTNEFWIDLKNKVWNPEKIKNLFR
jgi:hypothetical protein